MASPNPDKQRRHLFRRAKTAASLPARVVACEDRCRALETNVEAALVEMRGELAEIHALLTVKVESDADTTELIGRLLRSAEQRLGSIEERIEPADRLGQLVSGLEEHTD